MKCFCKLSFKFLEGLVEFQYKYTLASQLRFFNLLITHNFFKYQVFEKMKRKTRVNEIYFSHFPKQKFSSYMANIRCHDVIKLIPATQEHLYNYLNDDNYITFIGCIRDNIESQDHKKIEAKNHLMLMKLKFHQLRL